MNNKGSLAIALLLILVLSSLSAAILLRSTNENWAAKRVADSSAALWAAEAGVQKVYWEYNYNNCLGMVQAGTSTACISCSSCGGGNKAVAGTLTGYGDYDVTFNNASTTIQSVGSIPDRSAAKKVQRKLQTTISKPVTFSNGIFAQGQVTLNNNSYVDAYDSGAGAYGGNNIDKTNGNVGSNGTTPGIVSIDNGTNVWGNVSTGPGGTETGGGNVHGAITHTNSIPLPAVVVPSTLTSLSSLGELAGTQILNSGNYKYTDLNLGNKDTLTVNGTVRLYLIGDSSHNSIVTQNNININIAVGASLIVYTDGIINIGNGSINTGSRLPANFQIYSTYTGAGGVTLGNNDTTYTAIYAPQTDIVISNQNWKSGFYGAVVGKTVKLDNNGDVHYDKALASMANPFQNAIISNWQEY